VIFFDKFGDGQAERNHSMWGLEKLGAVKAGGSVDAIPPPIFQTSDHHFSVGERSILGGFDEVVGPLLTETASHSEIDVTHSKQTIGRFLTETRIVPLPGLSRAFFAEQFDSQNRISNRFWPKNRSHRKETIKPFLTGARTAFSAAQFRAEFRTEAKAQCKKECGSRDASEQGKIASNMRKEKELL
jgi:hypothetical protein